MSASREASYTEDSQSMSLLKPGVSVAPRENSTDDEMAYKLGAAKLLGYLREQESGELHVETSSVYGVAMTMPQISRSCGWPRVLTFVCIRGYASLLLNFTLQLWIVYLLNSEELIMDKLGGKMHLCNFAANLNNCPDGDGCVGPGGTRYTSTRLYDYTTWATRNYVRDSFHALFPDKAAEIDASVDPGEFGVENSMCRFVCVLIFVMSLMGEFNFIVDGFRLMFTIPTKDEKWVRYELPEWADKAHAKSVHGWTELDLVKIRIGGMPLHWKLINVFTVLLPKAFLWFCILSAGTMVLLNTSGIDDIIINSTALGFVLNLDELVFVTTTGSMTRTILEKTESYPLYSLEAQEGMADREALAHNEEHELRPTTKERVRAWMKIMPGNSMVCFVIWVIVIWWYFNQHCYQSPDGTWVSKEIHLPRTVTLSLGQALFPTIFKLEEETEASWSMPDPPN